MAVSAQSCEQLTKSPNGITKVTPETVNIVLNEKEAWEVPRMKGHVVNRWEDDSDTEDLNHCKVRR